jgi:alkyl hydroperoxide reductase subunit AhpF
MITITENLTTVTILKEAGTQDISGKVDKIKGLSTEDYTTRKTKLATLSNTGGTVDLHTLQTQVLI